WRWPEAWHEAYGRATNQLGGLVASYVLSGLPVSEQPITLRLPCGGSIGYSVRCRGTSVYIIVAEFEGPGTPNGPGPNGGLRRRPVSAQGLVLGVRGTGKCFTIVTFYGPLPSVPAGNILVPPRRQRRSEGEEARAMHPIQPQPLQSWLRRRIAVMELDISNIGNGRPAVAWHETKCLPFGLEPYTHFGPLPAPPLFAQRKTPGGRFRPGAPPYLADMVETRSCLYPATSMKH